MNNSEIKAHIREISEKYEALKLEDLKQSVHRSHKSHIYSMWFSVICFILSGSVAWYYYPSWSGFIDLLLCPITFIGIYSTRNLYLQNKKEYEEYLVRSVTDE